MPELSELNLSVNTVTPGSRIKSTAMTDRDFAALPPGKTQNGLIRRSSRPPCFLAALRAGVSGLRFDLYRLAEVLTEEGFDLTPERVKELAE